MANAYTHYWSNETWALQTKVCHETDRWKLDHSAGNWFRKRGVSRGDTVFIVTNIDGDMYLGGRIVVDRVCDLAQAARYLRQSAEDLWQAADHIVMSTDRAERFRPDNKVPRSIVRKLKFGDIGKALLIHDGRLDQQTLRGVRLLSPESAKLLEAIC